MLTYEIQSPEPPRVATDELWRVEFCAPVFDYDQVLCWVDNVPRQAAEALLQFWRTQPEGHWQTWCQRCPEGVIPSPHEHDALPEERGWAFTEMTSMRIMPMREAI
jgi:hypothetical protein